jgi:hypothetical protein
MKIKFLLLGFSILLQLHTELPAQLSPAGGYFGKSGNNDIVVGISANNAVAFYYFDYGLKRLDFGTGRLGANGQAAISASSGRVVTVETPRGTSIGGTYGGARFTAIYESPFGPLAGRSRGYTGTVVNPAATAGQLVAVLLIGIEASGKATLIFSNVAGLQGGVGTISASGVVTVPMTNGFVWNFVFNPSDGVAEGLINATLGTVTTLAPLQYLLVEAARPSLINIATRGTVGGGSSLTAGFVIEKETKILLIRAVGPTLGAFGVQGAQSDPVLTLYSGQNAIASNDDWGSADNTSSIQAAASKAGAFSLTNGGRDAAMLVTLEPGAYTAIVSGKSGSPAGDALVEVYEIR